MEEPCPGGREGHESYVTFCQLEDEAAFTCSADRTIRKWDVRTGQCLHVFRGHTSIVNRILVANNQLFSSSYDRTARAWSVDKGTPATIRAWDILSGEQLRVFREHQGSVICLELVNRHVYSGSADRTVKCWLADTGERVRTFAAHRHSVSALKYHAGTREAAWQCLRLRAQHPAEVGSLRCRGAGTALR
uniref:Uncharacterized protein n=1 Tax=Ursus maritimus TaxID=29073 RepID=A0A452UM99_URSMA